ncbi:unnamed protein product [Coregonus sp. 'balchen']|nr:unnamed protein product [Coregonus sp. 'balchen']
MDEKPGSSSAVAADSSVDVMAEAKKLIGAGNRHLVMGDVVSAVHVFQEACGILAERYGDTADECGEAFFLFPEESSEEGGEGEKPDSSKFESADNLDDKTRDELRMQVYDAMAEKKTTNGEDGKAEPNEKGKSESEAVAEGKKETMAKEEGAAKSLAKNGHDEKSEPPVNGVEEAPFAPEDEARKDKEAGKEEAVKEIGVKTSEEQNGEEAAEEKMEEEGEDDDDDDDDEGEGTAEDKESEDEEVGNLQLAWEMLEVAKVIYKRKENQEDQLMAAQAYLKLGEVGAESGMISMYCFLQNVLLRLALLNTHSYVDFILHPISDHLPPPSGNYPAAVEDFQDCLSLQLKHLPPHSRLLAETHYQLGMTYCYTGQYSQAIQHYSSSVKVIESRLAMLQEVMDKAEGEDGAKEKIELEELKLLLPDVAEKVEDAKESQSWSFYCVNIPIVVRILLFLISICRKRWTFIFLFISIWNQSADGASSSKSASDISHLVRKKRKTEESPVKDTDAKKTKQETTVNGSGDSGSAGNGVQEKGSQEAS